MTERRFQVLKLNNFKPLREVVFETLREAIIKGVLKPGERLMESNWRKIWELAVLRYGRLFVN